MPALRSIRVSYQIGYDLQIGDEGGSRLFTQTSPAHRLHAVPTDDQTREKMCAMFREFVDQFIDLHFGAGATSE